MSKSFCFNNKRNNECCNNNIKEEPKCKFKTEEICNKCLVVMPGQIGPMGATGPTGPQGEPG